MGIAKETAAEATYPIEEFIEHLADVVLLVGMESGRILGCNNAAALCYGYTRGELCSFTIERLRSEDSPTTIKLQMAAADSGSARFETIHRRKDGTLLPVEVSSRGAYLGPTRVLVSVVRDLTERHAALATLQASERMFTQAFHSSPGGFAISTLAEGRLIDVNESFLNLVGLGRENVIGRTLRELGLWKNPEQLDSIRSQLANERTIRGLECVFNHASGELAYGLVSATIIEVRGVSCLLTETVDITDRKRTEEQLRLVKTSIDRAPHAAYWMDPSGNFIYVNESGCRALGYSHDELLRMHVSDINPRASKERWHEVYRILKERQSTTIQSVHRRKDGSLMDVELTSSYFNDCGKEYCVGFAVDITERIKSERERELLQAQLFQAQKMESVGRLAGGVAHDFNNMLTIIQLSAQQGLDRLSPTDPTYEDLSSIRSAAKRSAALTNQLLAFARKQEIAPKVLDLNETITGMLNMLRRLLGENLQLNWQPGRALWPVLMDPTQLDQLLANLCINARDAISDVGTVAIETTNRNLQPGTLPNPDFTPGEYVEITVQDDGCGMDEQTQVHLFEPFYTTKGQGRGTGLGLATVYGIVKQNNGFIDVSSRLGGGSTFRIFLPREQRKPESPITEEPVSVRFERFTVLIVEDESAILNLLCRQLSKYGYEVLCAHNPREAIRISEQRQADIHLLLTDVVMPSMNGHELAAELRKFAPNMRCLYMSGYTADVIAHHGVIGEDIPFIQKPFTHNELLAKVREVLKQA